MTSHPPPIAVGNAFRERLRKFPSLVNCTTIDWFSEWPADALKSVASHFLLDLEFDTEHTRTAVEDMCMVFHQVGESALALYHLHSCSRPSPTSSTHIRRFICLPQTVRTLAVDFQRELQRFYYATPTSYLELIQVGEGRVSDSGNLG